MGFRFPRIVNAKNLIQRSFSKTKQAAASNHVADVPRGYLAVYVGDERKMKRFVIPVSNLNQPPFQELLSEAKEEFGFDHPMGGLTLLCREDAFMDLVSCLNGSC
ncbi:Small auxin-up RNA [Parasponia andersonii]|uniref:Small auxin-up RNA n=1 Tax=Parasponia andersonii TaxID=3476 RepID=A0A2P5AT88_PARAD|nr:Small auxin-up RNA [Parasponia andersonii]